VCFHRFQSKIGGKKGGCGNKDLGFRIPRSLLAVQNGTFLGFFSKMALFLGFFSKMALF